MAINISHNQVKIAEQNYYGKYYKIKYLRHIIYFYIKLFNKLKNLLNKFKIYFFYRDLNSKDRIKNIPELKLNKISDIDILKKNYDEFGYCFVQNLFSSEYYKLLNLTYPTKEFFDEPKNPFKNYKVGFIYNKLQPTKYNPKEGVKNIKYFPVLEKLYNFITNESEFEKFINEVISKKGYKNIDIWTSLAKEGSYLIPHQDSVLSDSNFEDYINCIYFVDGGDDAEYSGGTGIYNDNEFLKPVFIPKNLKNSMIIYNSKSKFYHGFKIMKKNSFRKAISFQFSKH